MLEAYLGKDPALAVATCLPFGLSTKQHWAWLTHGGARQLEREGVEAVDADVALEVVSAALAVQRVIAQTAVKPVGKAEALERVCRCAAKDDLGALARQNRAHQRLRSARYVEVARI